MRNDIVYKKDVLDLLSMMPPEEGITRALLIQSVKQLPSAEPDWTPCSKKLPDSNEYVLVTDYGETCIGRRFDGRWLDCYGDKMKDVTAWMEKPKPYKGEENEQI